ncbi:hypothetical protein ZWY2020_054341 [Hordeum vulgare]|nr:hypothetical protein ZWY2020_054341 [Hordeum vulgare]
MGGLSPARESHWSQRVGTGSPSPPDRRHGWSTSPVNQRPSAGSSPLRRYVPPHSQPRFPPPKGPNNGRGPQGAKKKKRKPPPPPPPLLGHGHPAPKGSTAPAGDGPPCFNYGLSGHLKVACPNPPTCYICKDIGHPVVLCLDRLVSEELMVYGHGIEGLAFFHMEILDRCAPAGALPLGHQILCVGHWRGLPRDD